MRTSIVSQCDPMWNGICSWIRLNLPIIWGPESKFAVFDRQVISREVLHKLIRNIVDIAELPPQLLCRCWNMGWSDEEIVENLGDAIDYLNSLLWCDQSGEIPLEMLFAA